MNAFCEGETWKMFALGAHVPDINLRLNLCPTRSVKQATQTDKVLKGSISNLRKKNAIENNGMKHHRLTTANQRLIHPP